MTRIDEIVAAAAARKAAEARRQAEPQAGKPEPGRPPEAEREPEAEHQPGPEVGSVSPLRAEIHDDLQHIGRQIDELGARREEINREIRDEPSIRPPEPQAEPVLESTWEADEEREPYPAPEPEIETDFEAEMEL